MSACSGVRVLVLVDEHVVEHLGELRACCAVTSRAPSRTAAGRRSRARAAHACVRCTRRRSRACRHSRRGTTGSAASARRRASRRRSPFASRCRRASPCAGSDARAALKPSSSRSRFITSAASAWSSTVKSGVRPSARPCSRSSRFADGVERAAPDAGRVDPCSVARPAMRSAREVISRAARRLNVSSSIRSGRTPSASSHATREASVVGLARAGAGDDQQRTLAVRRGFSLSRVQGIFEHVFEDATPATTRVRAPRRSVGSADHVVQPLVRSGRVGEALLATGPVAADRIEVEGAAAHVFREDHALTVV